jgi:hypothetical protein
MSGGEAMSDETEVGIVLANAPRLERAFGRRLAAVITLASLYFSRRTMSTASLTSILFALALILQAWLKLRG